jgi:hypothetical protein
MRKFDPRSQTKIANALLAARRKIWLRGVARHCAPAFVSSRAVCCAATVSAIALLVSSPASAQFMCTTTASDINCTNSGTAAAPFTNNAAGANQNATTTNSGTADGFASQTTAGGNAAVTNSGSVASGVTAATLNGGDATATNSGSAGTGVAAVTLAGGNATATNSGSTGVSSATLALAKVTGDATAINSGTSNGVGAAAQAGNATATNSGTSTFNPITKTGGIVAATVVSGNATVTNSGSNLGGNIVAATGGIGDAFVNNSGSNIHGTIAASATGTGNAAVINSGVAQADINPKTMLPFDAIEVVSFFGNATLTNVVGARVFGGIVVDGATQNVNFVGGNWLQTIAFGIGTTVINANGAPFVVGPTSISGTNTIAVLDPTTFALADRALVNFTGGVSQIIQDRFNGLAAGGGGALATSFAPTGSDTAASAQAAFAGIPSLAMSYASDSRPLIGKAAAPAAAHYDTTVWASGFGGERKQHADGSILPTTDTAYGGAMGVDRIVGSNLRLGAFVGAGASREKVELDVQSIDATYVFGGVYGRFDWRTQYLDFALYGGGINNKSARGIANNTVPGGFENATASYGGWFISPEVTYGYRIPVKSVLVTPRLRVRYVGGELDGFSESGSMQNLTVGRRAINDLEERAEVELSTVHPLAGGTMKALVNFGAIGLERLGNPTINTVLLAQSLSFTTPGERNAVGGVLGAGLEYWPMPNVSVFLAGEGTAMSDKSASFAGKGGARVSF